MKAFIVLACFVAVIVAQSTTTTTKRPAMETARPTTTTKRPTTKPPVDCDIEVGEDDWAVLLPNPKDCGSYYVCDHGEAILMPCPAGLHFNPELLVCDWPAEAGCTVENGEKIRPSP